MDDNQYNQSQLQSYYKFSYSRIITIVKKGCVKIIDHVRKFWLLGFD